MRHSLSSEDISLVNGDVMEGLGQGAFVRPWSIET